MNEWLDEDDADLSGLSVQQNGENDEYDTTPIIYILYFLVTKTIVHGVKKTKILGDKFAGTFSKLLSSNC